MSQFRCTDDTRKRVVQVQFHKDPDESPDLSHLGEYSNKPGPNAVDRKECGDWARGQFRYFNVTLSAKDTGNPDSVREDYERMEAYNRGDWGMYHCYAVASVSVGGVMQKVYSAGLSGVESDSGDDYFETVMADELSSLTVILTDLGFALPEIEAACERCKRETAV